MLVFKRILAAVAALIVLLVIVAFFLPGEAVVTRSTEIAAPASKVFTLTGDLRRFNEWSPWADIDPGMTTTFTGPADGVGQTMNWKSDNEQVGSGSIAITRLDPDRSTEVAIDVEGQSTAASWIALDPNGERTRVTWGFKTDLGLNPVSRYMGLMFDRWIGPDYEKGLSRLKSLAEREPAPV
jgi:hypothetical protein